MANGYDGGGFDWGGFGEGYSSGQGGSDAGGGGYEGGFGYGYGASDYSGYGGSEGTDTYGTDTYDIDYGSPEDSKGVGNTFDFEAAKTGAKYGSAIGSIFGLPGMIMGAIVGGIATGAPGIASEDYQGELDAANEQFGGYDIPAGTNRPGTQAPGVTTPDDTVTTPGETPPALDEDIGAAGDEEQIIRKKSRQRMGFMAMRRFQGTFFNPFLFTPEAFAGSLKK